MKTSLIMLAIGALLAGGCASGRLHDSAGADRETGATNQNSKATNYQALPLNEKGEYQNPATDK
jgi:hypothetical protein